MKIASNFPKSMGLSMMNLTTISKRRLIHAHDLLRELVARDMKVRYKRSALGFAWSMLNPLLHLLVLYFIFGLVLTNRLPRYPSFLFSGVLVYTWFQSSLSQATTAITGNRELLRRPGFPVPILPVVTVLTNLIHFLLSLPILVLVLILEGSALNATVLVLPMLIALQFVLTLGLAYLAASVNVIFRDTEYLLNVLLRLFFFLTPIFYQAEVIPTRFQPFYRLNPLVPLLEAYRSVFIDTILPDWSSLILPTVLALLCLYVGHWNFMRVNYRFVEEL